MSWRRLPRLLLAFAVVAGGAALVMTAPAQTGGDQRNVSAETRDDQAGVPAETGDDRAAASTRAGDRHAAAPARTGEPHAGKPVAAFSIDHELIGEPGLGVPLQVRLTLRPQSSIEDVSLELSTEAGLQLASSDTALHAAAATRDTPVTWTITVVPIEAGLLHLNVYAEGAIDGNRQGRSLMVPIRTGEPSVPSTENARQPESGDSEAQGERLIKLPAE